MFGSQILEVAIGLFFIFLLLSLVASAVREIIESIFKTRSTDLHRGVRELLGGDDDLTEKLYRHPLVHSLYLDGYRPPPFWGSTLPSYIPSANFALALLDLAARPTGAGAAPDGVDTPPLTLENVRTSLGTISNPDVRRALLIAIDRAEGDFTRAQANVEAWFDSSMDRVSGWYKRSTQYILLGIGFVVAIAANVDTIAIARYLYQNDTARSVVAVRAEVFTAEVNGAGGLPDTVSDALRKRVTAELDSLKAIGLPIGWRLKTPPASDATSRRKSTPDADAPATVATVPTTTTPTTAVVARDTTRSVTSKAPGLIRSLWSEFALAFPGSILGWILTALAVSLGAPFWFDVLNRVMVIRSTVKPQEKSLNERPEDPQPKGGVDPSHLGGKSNAAPASTPTGGATPKPPP